MASPLFRWTFGTPRKPVQRTDSEETFYEGAEMVPHGMDEPHQHDDGTRNQVPVQQSLIRTSDKSVPQQGFPSVQSLPNRDFIKPNSQNNNEMGSSRSFPNETNNRNMSKDNSQAFNWTIESGSDAFRNADKSTFSSDETFFQAEEDSNDFQEDVVPVSSPEILTGLSDSQFNAYPDVNQELPLSDKTIFEMGENFPGGGNTQEECQVTYENLTGTGYSQFDVNSSQQLSDGTFFDEAGNRKTNFEQRTSQEGTFFEHGSSVSKNGVELPSSSNGYSVIGIFPHQEGGYFDTSSLVFRPEAGRNPGIAELIQNLAACPVVPVFDEASVDDFMEVLNDPLNPNGVVGDEDLNDIVEICSQLQLENTFPNDDSTSSQTASDKNLKRTSSPRDCRESKKRRFGDPETQQRPKSIGKPPMRAYKKRTAGKKPHPMTLRSIKVLREDVGESATQQSGSSQSERKLSQRKTSCNADVTGAGVYKTRNQKSLKSTPSPKGFNVRQRKKTPKSVEIFEVSSSAKRKRGRPARNVESEWETDGKRYVNTLQKLRKRKNIRTAEETIQDPLRVQLDRDEALLRNIRKHLVDIIFDETPISEEELDSMAREITETQRRVLQWKKLRVGDEDEKISGRVNELETLCDNMRYQIRTLRQSSSGTGSSRYVTPSETNYNVSRRSDIRCPVETRSPQQQQQQQQRPQNIYGKSSVGVVSKKVNLKRSVLTKFSERTSQTKQTPNARKLTAESSRREESRYATVPVSNTFVSQQSYFETLRPIPVQRRRNTSRKNSKENSEGLSKKSNPLGDISNRGGKQKAMQANQKEILNRTPALVRVINEGVRRTKSPRRPPIKFLSGQDLREDTLHEHTPGPPQSLRLGGSFGLGAPTDAAPVFATIPTKTVVDVGVNTDFVEHHVLKKSFVDRGTNTDPEDFNRQERKVVVDRGMNTDFDFNLGGWTVSRSTDKENVQPKIDWKSIKYVWRPRREDFLPISYDPLNLPDLLKNPNAKLPQELEEDLTWSD